MRSPTYVFLASFCVACGAARAADATSPVDPTLRNSPYTPVATVVPDKQVPAAKANRGVQERKYETSTIERQTAPQAGQRAAIEVQEVRAKNIIDKDSHRPEGKEQPVSAFNHRSSAISTDADTKKPPTVAKYQDSLTSASAANMARFPALDRATTAKINRFVFRKNPTEQTGALDGAVVTPAAGGSVVTK